MTESTANAADLGRDPLDLQATSGSLSHPGSATHAVNVEAVREHGAGTEGEIEVWHATYSMRNFLGRIVVRALLTLFAGWLSLKAFYYNIDGYPFFAYVVLMIMVVAWVHLAYRMVYARYGHYYRLTNRRLFVSTGLLRRRRDQMELIHVKDVFIRQTLSERLVKLGTVVVVSGEKEAPTFYLTGVRGPHKVMDLVWHYARAERDNRTTQIDKV